MIIEVTIRDIMVKKNNGNSKPRKRKKQNKTKQNKIKQNKTNGTKGKKTSQKKRLKDKNMEMEVYSQPLCSYDLQGDISIQL